MPELITKSEYARRRNCDPSAVTRAVQRGWITVIDGKIDPVVADVQWAAAARPRTDSRPATEMGAKLSGQAPRAPAGSAPDGASAGGTVGSFDYFEARARRESAEAQLSELRLQEATGMLVKADQVRSEAARLAASLREALMQLPARLVPVLAAESSPEKIALLLESELRTVLAQLADAA